MACDPVAFRPHTLAQTSIHPSSTRPTNQPTNHTHNPQDNVHISLFTVRETLEYAALLRLDEQTPPQKRKERAEDVMRMLGLEDVADVVVGSPMVKGISGGQARRLTIGVEIVQLPDGASSSGWW